jgi:hypothetical protein
LYHVSQFSSHSLDFKRVNKKGGDINKQSFISNLARSVGK